MLGAQRLNSFTSLHTQLKHMLPGLFHAAFSINKLHRIQTILTSLQSLAYNPITG